MEKNSRLKRDCYVTYFGTCNEKQHLKKEGIKIFLFLKKSPSLSLAGFSLLCRAFWFVYGADWQKKKVFGVPILFFRPRRHLGLPPPRRGTQRDMRVIFAFLGTIFYFLSLSLCSFPSMPLLREGGLSQLFRDQLEKSTACL